MRSPWKQHSRCYIWLSIYLRPFTNSCLCVRVPPFPPSEFWRHLGILDCNELFLSKIKSTVIYLKILVHKYTPTNGNMSIKWPATVQGPGFDARKGKIYLLMRPYDVSFLFFSELSDRSVKHTTHVTCVNFVSLRHLAFYLEEFPIFRRNWLNPENGGIAFLWNFRR